MKQPPLGLVGLSEIFPNGGSDSTFGFWEEAGNTEICPRSAISNW